MALRLLGNPLKRTIVPFGNRGGHSVASVTPKIGPDGVPTEHHIYGTEIGTRDIVGFGWNGFPTYADRSDFPLPAIRWREETPEITVMKQHFVEYSLRLQFNELIFRLILAPSSKRKG